MKGRSILKFPAMMALEREKGVDVLKSTKDHSAKLTAVSAVLDQLTPDILKTSDGEALRKFHAVVQRWAELAAAELMRRDDDR
jgi:hypothetical protein